MKLYGIIIRISQETVIRVQRLDVKKKVNENAHLLLSLWTPVSSTDPLAASIWTVGLQLEHSEQAPHQPQDGVPQNGILNSRHQLKTNTSRLYSPCFKL